MGYWETYKGNFRGGAVLTRRYILVGLVVPVTLALYLWGIGDGIFAPPEGEVVDWWMQSVTELFEVVKKTDTSLAELGVPAQVREFSSFAYSVLIFNVFLNGTVQALACLYAEADTVAAKAFVTNIRENLRLDIRIYFFLMFSLFLVLVYFFLFQIGFEPKTFRRSGPFGELYFMANFIIIAGLQYFLGTLVMIAVVLLREKLI